MTIHSERLREARLRAGYATATDAARAFGWTPSTYMGHENGSRGLRKEAAQRYARGFGVSWTWLLGGDEEMADHAEVSKQFALGHKDASERELILLAGSQITFLLEYAIAEKLGTSGGPELANDLLGSHDAPQSLRQKTSLAQAIGLINTRERELLLNIFSLRDLVLHSRSPNVLDDPQIAERLATAVAAWEGEPNSYDRRMLIIKYEMACSTLSLLLGTGSRIEVAKQMQAILDDFLLEHGLTLEDVQSE